MTMKIKDDADQEIEVYTAEEVKAQVDAATTAAVQKKDDEFKPIKTGLESELGEAKKALTVRAGEFAQFRKLSDEQVEKLSVAERTIYENGLALQKEREGRETAEKKNIETARDTVISKKANGNDKLIEKMKEWWPLIGIDATTPDQLEAKANIVLGALSTQAPDLLAGVAGFTGTYAPPNANQNADTKFSDTEKGKAGASELGLTLEVPKK